MLNDDDSVIVKCAEHVLCTSLSSRTSRIVDGRTQCMPLSAPINNPRSAGRKRGTQSMLLVTVVRKPVTRLPRGDCSDQHRGPERAWCVVPLSVFEYYAYSINHGQESACGGRIQPHGLAVSVLNIHERTTHTTSPSGSGDRTEEAAPEALAF